MMNKSFIYCFAFAAIFLTATLSNAALIYKIDINDADNPATATGWTGLNANHGGNGGSVTIDGVTFAPFSADGSRLRLSSGNPNPDALLGDFVYDDGSGQAVGLLFGGAGDLQAGTWEVEMYASDSGVGNQISPQIAAYRENGSETIISSNVLASLTDPAITFTFESDGVSAYDVFFRENNSNDRARLNAVSLRFIPVPEPSSIVLFILGLLGLVWHMRRKK